MADIDKPHDVPADDAQLAGMGHKPELQRNFSTLYVATDREEGWVDNPCLIDAMPCAAGRCWAWLLRS